MKATISVGQIDASIKIGGVTVAEYHSDGKHIAIDTTQKVKRGQKVWYITNEQLRRQHEWEAKDYPDPLPAVVVRVNKLTVRIKVEVSSPYEMSVDPTRIFERVEVAK